MAVKYLYRLYISYLIFVKQIYRSRGIQTTAGATALAYLTIMAYIHFILVCVEHFSLFDLGVIDFWIDPKGVKSLVGYSVGILLLPLIFGVPMVFSELIPQAERITCIRSALANRTLKTYSYGYVIGSGFAIIGAVVIMLSI